MIGSSTKPTAQYCVNALYLPSRCAGSTMPRRPASERYERDADLARRDDEHRPPREVAAVREHREPAEHDELVGDGIEERARARRAVAAREPAVEAVGGGDREPERDRRPAEPAVADQQRASGSRRAMRATVTKLAGVASAP